MADADKTPASGVKPKWALRVGKKMSTLAEQNKQLAKDLAEANDKLSKAPKSEDFEKLNKQVTASKHRSVLDKTATELGLDPNKLDDLLKLSDYQPNGEPDPSAIKAFLTKASEGRDWAKAASKGESDGQGEGNPAPSKLSKGEGHGKGSTDTKVGGFKVTNAQLANGDWMRANRADMQKHSAAGTLTIID